MLDWIFGPQCVACGEPADTLCSGCAATLVELGPACPRCAEPTGDDVVPGSGPAFGLTCRRCVRQPLPLDRIVAPWRFGGQLAAAIKRLKFAHRTHLARDLAPLWAPILASAVAGHPAVVVAVPLHWKRRWIRGFDHAWLLARHGCAAAGIAPPVAALRRVRGAPPQSTLPASQRAANVRGAFVVRDPSAVAGRTVILVDDVVTTGATLAAAARPLRRAGATAIIGVAIARATSAPES